MCVHYSVRHTIRPYYTHMYTHDGLFLDIAFCVNLVFPPLEIFICFLFFCFVSFDQNDVDVILLRWQLIKAIRMQFQKKCFLIDGELTDDVVAICLVLDVISIGEKDSVLGFVFQFRRSIGQVQNDVILAWDDIRRQLKRQVDGFRLTGCKFARIDVLLGVRPVRFR